VERLLKVRFRGATPWLASYSLALSALSMRFEVWRSKKDKGLHLLCGEGAEAFNALPAAIRHLGPWTGGAEGDIKRLRLTRVVDHQRSDRLTAAPSDLWQLQFNLGQKRRGQLVRFGGDAAIGRSGDGGYVPLADSCTAVSEHSPNQSGAGEDPASSSPSRPIFLADPPVATASKPGSSSESGRRRRRRSFNIQGTDDPTPAFFLPNTKSKKSRRRNSQV